MSELILEEYTCACPFSSLKSLEDLNLSKISLFHLGNEYFQGLENLKNLDLS